MEIKLERHTGPERERTPYVAQIDSSDVTIHTPSVFRVPIQAIYSGTQKSYEVSICGFRLVAETPNNLLTRIETLVGQLINIARFPEHVFVARRAKTVYPVYTIGSEVMVTTPGGPIFQHVELAKVREYLTDYLHQIDVLGENGVSDKLHVRGINMHTLGLRRPAFYLKKRLAGEDDFWSPVFENGVGDGFYTLAVNARRDVPFNEDGQAVLRLCQLVAELLLTDGRLHDRYDLRPDRLMLPVWESLRDTLTAEEPIQVNGRDFPIYRTGKTWLSVEQRPDEERYGLFWGRSPEEVRGRMSRDFIRRGLAVA